MRCSLSHVRGSSRRRWLVAALLASTLVVGIAVALPAVARARLDSAAKARGVALEGAQVRVSFRGIVVDDLRASLEGVDGLRLVAKHVLIGWFDRRALSVDGFELTLRGSSEELAGKLSQWRARHPGGERAGTGGSPLRLRAREGHLRWTEGGPAAIDVRLAELSYAEGLLRISGGEGTVRKDAALARFRGLGCEVARDGKIGAVEVGHLSLEAAGLGTTERAPNDAAAPSSAERSPQDSAAPNPPPNDAAPERIESSGLSFATGVGPWPRIAALRAEFEKAIAHVRDGVEWRIGELEVATPQGALGPWSSRIGIATDAVTVTIEPTAHEGRRPLALHAFLPRRGGRLSAELRAGPATLAELGIAEGAFHLTDVAQASIELRGSVELDPDAKTFAADGSVTLRSVAISDERIADGTLRAVDLALRGVVASKDELRAWTLTGGALELGKVRIEAEGSVDFAPEGVKTELAWSVPPVDCGDALASMPKGLLPRVGAAKVAGSFSARGRILADAKALDRTLVDLDLDQRCRFLEVPATMSLERFRSPFDLRVYDPKGSPRIARFGPGTAGWVSLGRVSPYVIDAVTTCEDAAFFVHRGYSAAAIKSAIVANIKAGKFAVGASTVTMQLAKNVFLERRKQLGRKLEEALLTAWLEQGFSKNEILELYLNVIEFGPNLYGIGPASQHWFGRPASDLDPLEATFLISLLPSPVRRHAMWEKGAPSDGYLQYVRALLKEEHRRGKLEDDEYQAAIARPLVFHRPGDPPPPPRSIVPARANWDGDDGADHDPIAPPY